MEEGQWYEELNRRIKFLQCRTCGGVNPYVCECAKKDYLKSLKKKTPKPCYISLEDRDGWGDLDAPKRMEEAQERVSL